MKRFVHVTKNSVEHGRTPFANFFKESCLVDHVNMPRGFGVRFLLNRFEEKPVAPSVKSRVNCDSDDGSFLKVSKLIVYATPLQYLEVIYAAWCIQIRSVNDPGRDKEYGTAHLMVAFTQIIKHVLCEKVV